MILVIGGTGRLGRLVVDDLVTRDEVRVLARRATASAARMPRSVQLVDGDVRDPATVAAAAQGVSCIVIASHGVESRERDGLKAVDELGSRAVGAAARRAECGIVLMSMVGAGPHAAMPLARTKWAAENEIRESGAPWTIVRATAFAQTWAMILTESAGRSGRPGIIGAGETVHRFIDARDVASVVARAATDLSLRGRTLQLCGPDELTVSQLAVLVKQANSWTGPPRHLPVPLARTIAASLAPFRADLARKLSLAIAMNDPDSADALDTEMPSWVATRAISVETMGDASTATGPEPARPTARSRPR